MGAGLPFDTVLLFSNVVITLAFGYLVFREKETYLAQWTYGWMLLACNTAVHLLMINHLWPGFFIISRLFQFAGAFFLLQGTLIFLNIRFTKYWWIAGGVFIVFTLFAFLSGYQYYLLAMPVTVFTGLIFLVMGFVFIGTRLLHGLAKYLIGLFLTIWGIQGIVTDILIRNPGMRVWSSTVSGFYAVLIALFMLISYFDKTRDKQEESETRYRSLFHENRAAMFLYDPETKAILDMNNTALEFYGYTRDAIFDLTVFDISLKGEDFIEPFIIDALRMGTRRYESNHRVADGSARDVEVFTGTITLDGRTVLSAIVNDISERKQVEREVQETKNQLEKANQIKQEFMANISHELRTPLNGILGMASLLKATELNEEQLNYLDMINLSGENLYRVINDILNFSEVVSKDFELQVSDFNLYELLDSILKRYRGEASTKNLDLRCSFDTMVPQMVKTDKLRLSQICINILSNAIKFTEEGWIEVSVLKDGEDTLIRVSDTGVGIEKENLDDIFGLFTLGVSTYTKRYAGAGIGLAIVKELVDKLGGTIEVSSELGEGSEFTVRLPLEVSREVVEISARTAEERETVLAKEHIRILVAEDEVINRMYIEEFLRLHGAEVVSVRTGEDAFEAALKESFDIILMDISMPKMNGLEAARLIRSQEKKRVPIIALTAYTYPEDIRRCTDAGMDDFLPKPVDESLLMDIMNKYLD